MINLVSAELSIKRGNFRSRPVVKLEAELSFVTEAGKIDLASQDCQLSTGEAVACVPIKTCLKYTGLGVEKKIGNTDHNALADRAVNFYCKYLTQHFLGRGLAKTGAGYKEAVEFQAVFSLTGG